MRVRFVLPLAAIAFVAACGGSSSTGIKPPADTQVITVTNAGFTPSALSVINNTEVIWKSTEGSHVVTFTGTIPANSNPNSSRFGMGDSVDTRFVTIGTFTYKDSVNAANTGTITVHN